LMLLCCDSHTQQQHSMDVFRQTVICTGNKWTDWTCLCWPAYNSNTTNKLYVYVYMYVCVYIFVYIYLSPFQNSFRGNISKIIFHISKIALSFARMTMIYTGESSSVSQEESAPEGDLGCVGKME